jgi:hypothetical protein
LAGVAVRLALVVGLTAPSLHWTVAATRIR